jgi:hypothetical protein
VCGLNQSTIDSAVFVSHIIRDVPRRYPHTFYLLFIFPPSICPQPPPPSSDGEVLPAALPQYVFASPTWLLTLLW